MAWKMPTSKNKKINLLDTIPVHLDCVHTEWEDGCTTLVLPRFRKAWMQKWFLPKAFSPYVRIRLEEHGTAVWGLIDGQRSVHDIIGLLESHFEGDESYPTRVAAYLLQLQRDGFIKLMTKADR